MVNDYTEDSIKLDVIWRALLSLETQIKHNKIKDKKRLNDMLDMHFRIINSIRGIK